ncbi:hypothetical protein QTP86_006603 [Hemibagrus guttatus]|nr:hypothetical protein QTP86_006603 [Hemibagrus guttatus]
MGLLRTMMPPKFQLLALVLFALAMLFIENQIRKLEESRSKLGKGRELADVMERRKVDILCVQETRWKGSKACSIGAGFKLFYYGVDSKRNGVGVVLKEEFVRNVLEVGCELEEKERFWSELDEVMESIPTGDEEVMGKFGVKERNLEGQMVVDFAKRMDMGVVNTYFQKREEHRVTYKSGGRRTQIEKKTKWWKLKKEECSEVIRETGRKVLGVSSGRRKEDKETWWWNEEVQDSVQRKRLAKKKWDMDRTEENRQEYKELQRRVKREVSKAKQKAYEELYTRLDTREGEKDLYRVLTSEESVQRRWKEYFEELMNEENEREKRVEGVNSVEQKVDKIRKDEVRKALKRMKSGKAVGPDDIPVEVWKCLGEAAVEFLANLFNRVLENLEKAYDRVPREELWYCMRKSGVAEKYVRVVQDMYERSRTVVRCAVVMDQLSEEVRQESPWTMMFADDIVICSESREQVEENLERWRFALERRGMKVLEFEMNLLEGRSRDCRDVIAAVKLVHLKNSSRPGKRHSDYSECTMSDYGTLRILIAHNSTKKKDVFSMCIFNDLRNQTNTAESTGNNHTYVCCFISDRLLLSIGVKPALETCFSPDAESSYYSLHCTMLF